MQALQKVWVHCMTLWLLVTKDKYELPLAVARTANELGKMVGVTGHSILRNVLYCKRRNIKCRYIKVDIEESED